MNWVNDVEGFDVAGSCIFGVVFCASMRSLFVCDDVIGVMPGADLRITRICYDCAG